MEASRDAALYDSIELTPPACKSARLCMPGARVTPVCGSAKAEEQGFTFGAQSAPALYSESGGTASSGRRVALLLLPCSSTGGCACMHAGRGCIPWRCCIPEGDVNEEILDFRRTESPNVQESSLSMTLIIRVGGVQVAGSADELWYEDFTARYSAGF